MMSYDFKVIPHLMLNKTHLITGSSNIISSENLAEKSQWTFWNFLSIEINLTTLEHDPFLASFY